MKWSEEKIAESVDAPSFACIIPPLAAEVVRKEW